MKSNEIMQEGFWSTVGKHAVDAAASLGHKPSQDASAMLNRQVGPATKAAPTGGAGAFSQMSDRLANTAAQTAQTPDTAAQTPAVDPAIALFKDPTVFKAEWDKFIASNPNFKLISDPALIAVLKKMWMQSGGTKLESKNTKKKRV